MGGRRAEINYFTYKNAEINKSVHICITIRNMARSDYVIKQRLTFVP